MTTDSETMEQYLNFDREQYCTVLCGRSILDVPSNDGRVGEATHRRGRPYYEFTKAK